MEASHTDPFARFSEWFEEAKRSEPLDPGAMALATVDRGGMPNVRMVLMKGFDSNGFVFFTNTESVKGEELTHAAFAALCFHWKSIRRQVRIRGPVEPVTLAEADAYFASRPRGSQIAAWASRQSRPLPSRAELEEAVADVERRYRGKDVPRPPHWSGFRVRPLRIEFWQDREYRLHERLAFHRADPDAPWETALLYP